MFFKAKRHQISKNCALSDEIKPKIIFITDILINVRNKSITDLEKASRGVTINDLTNV